MNCDLPRCQKHILATMQVNWNGQNFHAECIAEAVAQSRAKTEIPKGESNLPDNYFEQLEESFNDEPFEDEYVNYENEELIDEIVERLDNMPDVSDEILNQIPVAANNGGQRNVVIPEVVAPVAVVNPAGNGTLIAHCGAGIVSRGGLLGLPLPEETDTFKPISHYFLVQAIEEALAFRHINITKEEFAVTPDGMKFFAVLQVNARYEGVNFAIGLRNSNDKSMRLGIVAGYKVIVCDNLSFAGEYKPMLAKHSKNLDLVESVSTAVDRLQRGWKPIREMIDFKRNHELLDDKAREMLYRLFTDAKLPISLFRTTHREYFERALYEEFNRKTLWRLENAVTTALKKLNPISHYENTAKLGKFITDYTAAL
jgi:hypothetical protein